MSHSLRAVLAFAIQVITGAVAFLLVYSVALLVAAGIEHLSLSLESPIWLRWVGTALEVVIFLGDAAGLLLLIAYEIAKLARSLLEDWRRPDG